MNDAIAASYSSFCSLASLHDFSCSSSSWLSPSGCSETSCLTHLSSPPCGKLTRFMFLFCLNLISSTSYAKQGANSNIPSNTNCTQSMLPTVFIYSGLTGLAMMPHHHSKSPHCLPLIITYNSAQTPPSLLLLLAMAKVSGSDKLVKSSLIPMIKIDNGHVLVAHSP